MDDACFLIQFAGQPRESIHSEQGMVEIYMASGGSFQGSLQELEYHSSYKTLAPGEAFEATETWEILPYGGDDSFESHTSFLNQIKRIWE